MQPEIKALLFRDQALESRCFSALRRVAEARRRKRVARATAEEHWRQRLTQTVWLALKTAADKAKRLRTINTVLAIKQASRLTTLCFTGWRSAVAKLKRQRGLIDALLATRAMELRARCFSLWSEYVLVMPEKRRREAVMRRVFDGWRQRTRDAQQRHIGTVKAFKWLATTWKRKCFTALLTHAVDHKRDEVLKVKADQFRRARLERCVLMTWGRWIVEDCETSVPFKYKQAAVWNETMAMARVVRVWKQWAVRSSIKTGRLVLASGHRLSVLMSQVFRGWRERAHSVAPNRRLVRLMREKRERATAQLVLSGWSEWLRKTREKSLKAAQVREMTRRCVVMMCLRRWAEYMKRKQRRRTVAMPLALDFQRSQMLRLVFDKWQERSAKKHEISNKCVKITLTRDKLRLREALKKWSQAVKQNQSDFQLKISNFQLKTRRTVMVKWIFMKWREETEMERRMTLAINYRNEKLTRSCWELIKMGVEILKQKREAKQRVNVWRAQLLMRKCLCEWHEKVPELRQKRLVKAVVMMQWATGLKRVAFKAWRVYWARKKREARDKIRQQKGELPMPSPPLPPSQQQPPQHQQMRFELGMMTQQQQQPMMTTMTTNMRTGMGMRPAPRRTAVLAPVASYQVPLYQPLPQQPFMTYYQQQQPMKPMYQPQYIPQPQPPPQVMQQYQQPIIGGNVETQMGELSELASRIKTLKQILSTMSTAAAPTQSATAMAIRTELESLQNKRRQLGATIRQTLVNTAVNQQQQF